MYVKMIDEARAKGLTQHFDKLIKLKVYVVFLFQPCWLLSCFC